MAIKEQFGQFNYNVKTYPTFNGYKTRTGIDCTVLEFGTIRGRNGKDLKVDVLQETFTCLTLYINNENVGPYNKLGTLTAYFDDKTSAKLEHTIGEAKFDLIHNANARIYVPNPKLDDPIIRALEAKAKAFWSSNKVKLEQFFDEHLSTSLAFYKEEEDENGHIVHTKFRISNIKATTVNIDESNLVTHEDGGLIKPEAYVKTHTKINRDSIAHWFVFNQYMFLDNLANQETPELFKQN